MALSRAPHPSEPHKFGEWFDTLPDDEFEGEWVALICEQHTLGVREFTSLLVAVRERYRKMPWPKPKPKPKRQR